MTNALPDSLQPTREDFARDAELAARAKAILAEVEASGGGRVTVNTESYNSTSFGPDGKPVARIRNGVPLQTPADEAVARAQAAANHEIALIERELKRLIDMHNEIKGYDTKGNPLYVRDEYTRNQLQRQIRQQELGLVNQMRLNERRWRKDAAPAVQKYEDGKIKAAELAKELEAKGRVTRISGW